MRLTSARNPIIKYVRSLDRPAVRRQEQVYLAEGVRLVGEAVATGQTATLALYTPELLQRSPAGEDLLARLPDWAERTYEVDDRVLAAAAQTEHPAGVLAVLRPPRVEPLAAHAGDRFGVILDAVSDPGNAGTILRTAAAAGVGYVITSGPAVDPFSPKVVRAAMGAHFRVPIYAGMSIDEIRGDLPDVRLIASAAGAGTSIYRYSWPPQAALIVGSEAHGLSPQVGGAVSERVHIPMRSGVESLNAAVAASIIIYTALGPEISVAT